MECVFCHNRPENVMNQFLGLGPNTDINQRMMSQTEDIKVPVYNSFI